MAVVVRCPRCRGLSQVGAAAVGRVVACPTCGEPFRSDPLPAPPVVAPRRSEPVEESAPGDGPDGVLFGLALLPFGIPLLWLIGRFALGLDPVFSFAAPLAVGLGVFGLAVGVSLVRRWSHAARVRTVLLLAVGGYAVGGVLFVVPDDWPAAARKLFGPQRIVWKDFSPRPDKAYRVPLPDGPVPETPAAVPVDGWPLRTFTASAGQPDDKRGVWAVRYTLADGVPPGDATAGDDAWFAAVRDAVVAASGGELTDEKVLTVPDGKPARQLRLKLNRATVRVVRLVRVKDRLVYAAAEGLFLAADGEEVTRFLGGLAVR